MRGGTGLSRPVGCWPHNFNPPAPCGAGLGKAYAYDEMDKFQSTRPMRGGTGNDHPSQHSPSISIHPPHAGRDDHVQQRVGVPGISIHPPHAGRDRMRLATCRCRMYFNPPAPCGAGRAPRSWRPWCGYFNPPAPCGAGRAQRFINGLSSIFQSTRPMRGGTGSRWPEAGTTTFQSTRPMRGGTQPGGLDVRQPRISIHPPHAGRDRSCAGPARRSGNFNPPAPCGAGLQKRAIFFTFFTFSYLTCKLIVFRALQYGLLFVRIKHLNAPCLVRTSLARSCRRWPSAVRTFSAH